MHISNRRSLARSARMLCRQHLLGDHGELHKHRHNFVKGHSISGRRGAIDPMRMGRWHDALAAEMLRRGYKHESPYVQPDLSGYSVADRTMRVDEAATLEKMRRCPGCAERMSDL